MMKLIYRVMRDKTGATAIEYGIIVGLISIAAVSAMSGLGDQLSTTFNATSSIMANP